MKKSSKENLNNIEMSQRHIQRKRRYELRSVKNFARAFRMPENSKNTLKLYELCKAGKQTMPIPWKSYSTLARLNRNISEKTKMVDMAIAEHYAYGDISKATIKKLERCGSQIESIIGTTSDGNKHHHITKGFFCDFKLCPVRLHFTAQKRTNMISTELRAAYDKYSFIPVMLTLTIPNVLPTPRRIRKAYKVLTKSWKKMSKYKLYNGDNRFIKTNKGIAKGWIEKFEVTYNNHPYLRAYNTLHPHLHIILLVRKSYLMKQGSKYYIPQNQFVKDWKRALPKAIGKNVDKDAIYIKAPFYKNRHGKRISIKDCKTPQQVNNCIRHASKEIAKYEAKTSQFDKMPNLRHKFNSKRCLKEQAVAEKKRLDRHHIPCSLKKIKTLVKTSPKYRRAYLSRNLAPQQINAVVAFHAIYKGLQGLRVIHMGGFMNRISKMYKQRKLDIYSKMPEVNYHYKVLSVYKFKFKDYLDTKYNLSKKDIKKLKKEGFEINPININKTSPTTTKNTKKSKAIKLFKSLNYKKIIKMGESAYLKLCRKIGCKWANPKASQ